MPFMKKLILISSLLLAAVSFAIFPASAEILSGIEINESNFKPFFDFDTLPKTYKASDNPIKSGDGALNIDDACISWNAWIRSGIGVKGNALDLKIASAFDNLDYITMNATKKSNTDFSFATDFIFYLDTTKDIEISSNDTSTPRKRTIQIILRESDVLKDGSLNPDDNQSSAMIPLDSIFYIQENGQWVQIDTGDTNADLGKRTEGWKQWITIPSRYQGWIRIPFTSLKNLPGCKAAVNSDGEFNAKQIQQVSFGFGLWNKMKGAEIIIDQVGFYNPNINTPAKGKDTSITKSTEPSGNGTTAKYGAGDSSANIPGSPTGSSADSQSNGNPSNPDIRNAESEESSDTIVSNTTNTINEIKAADNKPHSLNSRIILTIVILIGGGTAMYFFVLKKKKQN